MTFDFLHKQQHTAAIMITRRTIPPITQPMMIGKRFTASCRAFLGGLVGADVGENVLVAIWTKPRFCTLVTLMFVRPVAPVTEAIAFSVATNMPLETFAFTREANFLFVIVPAVAFGVPVIVCWTVNVTFTVVDEVLSADVTFTQVEQTPTAEAIAC